MPAAPLPQDLARRREGTTIPGSPAPPQASRRGSPPLKSPHALRLEVGLKRWNEMHRHSRRVTVLLLGLSGVLPGVVVDCGLFAQGVERERQELVWPQAGILEVSPDLRSRLDLFPEVEAFRVARLLLREDGTAVLEIESTREGRIHRERRLLGDAELGAFRSDLDQRQAALGGRAVVTREGRGSLVLGHTLLALGYHGWAIPQALDMDSNQAAVATYLLTAGASFYIPYRLTRDRPVSDAHRGLSLYGGTRGIASGLFLGDLLVGDGRPDESTGDRDDRRSQARFAGGVVAGMGGGVMGFHAVDRWGPTEGTAALWGAMGDLGLVSGAALAWIAGPYAEEIVIRRDGDLVYQESRARNRQVGHAITLAGQGLGLGAGAWLSRHRTYSTGDVAVLRSAAVLGAQVGGTIVRAAGHDEGRGIAAGALGVGLGGVALGDHWLREVELSRGEGLLVNAGHLAGGATALGLTYLIVEDIDDHEVLYLTTSTLGSILGAGLVWQAVRSDGLLRARGDFGSRDTGVGRVPGAEGGVVPRRRSQGGLHWEIDATGLLLGALQWSFSNRSVAVHDPVSPISAGSGSTEPSSHRRGFSVGGPLVTLRF